MSRFSQTAGKPSQLISMYSDTVGRASPQSRLDPLPFWKRSLDLVCCAIAFPFFAMGTAIMVLLTKLTSPGPVFFKQERIGYNGQRFLCYKFRTMKAGADVTSHQAHLAQLMNSGKPMVKLDSKNDKRLIPCAWLLRASGLDELPQIINIARGEMSIVGPRPCLSYEYEKFEEWHKERFQAVPGLTGLWQVSGKNRTTFDEMIRLDVRYAKERSPWMDLWIIFMTVPALASQISDTRKNRRAPAPAAQATEPQPAAPVRVAQ